MSGFLFIFSAVGITATLAAFFRHRVSTPTSAWLFLQTGAIVLAAFTLFLLQGATLASFPAIHAAVLIGSHESVSLTTHDLLSILCCAVLGAAAHAHLSARIRNLQAAPDHSKRMRPVLQNAAHGGDVS